MRKKTKKLRRAQLRRKTPPVSFRSDDGERIVLLVDEGFTTAARCVTNSRSPILLSLAAGLKVFLGSRRINKRRYPALRIELP